jgi:hypothetical protein
MPTSKLSSTPLRGRRIMNMMNMIIAVIIGILIVQLLFDLLD